MIKESPWEEIVFPKPISPKEKQWQKIVDQVEEHYFKQKNTIESLASFWVTEITNDPQGKP